MNIFDLANIRGPKGFFTVREERVKRDGSPLYPWTPGAIAAGAAIAIEIGNTFPESRKYQPLDWLEITNNEAANNLTMSLNGGSVVLVVPAKTIKTVSNQAIWSIALTNNGGAITTAGLIAVIFQKQPLTIDQWARNRG